MLKTIENFIVGFCLVFFSLSSFADNGNELKRYYYKLRVPLASQTCAQQAEELKLRFTNVTKSAVVEAVCKGQHEILDADVVYKVNTIILTYMSERELLPYTAYFGKEYFGTPGEAEGVYLSYKSCLSDIQTRVMSFEALTGLSAVGANCQKGTYKYDKNFVLKIDGFSADPKQKPSQKLYAFAFKSRGPVTVELLEDIKQLIAKMGGEAVTKVNDTIFYYSKNPLSVSKNSFGIFVDGKECGLQLNEVKNLLNKAGSKFVIALCVKDADYPTTEYLEVVSDNALLNITSLSVSGYFSFEECMEDRSRAIDEATSRGFKPLGALCKKDFNGYEMQVFRNFY